MVDIETLLKMFRHKHFDSNLHIKETLASACDINFSGGTTAFYGFLGFLINGESTNGAGLSESNVQMPFSPGAISLRVLMNIYLIFDNQDYHT